MTAEELILHIEEEFEDLEPGKLKPDNNFRDIFDWNSINVLIFIAMIKTRYDVSLNAEELRNSNTIRDIVQILQKKIEA
jgi:acyl carrier protein